MKGFMGRTRAWGLAACVALATACSSDDPPDSAMVKYDDGVLTVEGQAFRREPSFDDKVYPDLPGRIVVQPRPGDEPVALALIQRYGLTLEGRSKEGWLLVKVPNGYQQQWASALTLANTARIVATTDSKSSPTPLATADPAPGLTAAGPAVLPPAAEPTDTDVQRLFIETYERIASAGGFPVTVTATGQSLLIQTKVFSARKRACQQLPHAPAGEWECTASLQVGRCTGVCDPEMEAPTATDERIRIRWNPAGHWALR